MFTLSGVDRNKEAQLVDLSEKIGIDKIRLRKIGAHSTTILRSVARADVLLQDWNKSGNGHVECEFEVMFIDGYLLKGKFDFKRKPLCRPSLRRHLVSICDGIVPITKNGGHVNSEQPRFLDVYE